MPEAIPDLFAPLKDREGAKHVYTVSEITHGIKLVLEDSFGQVWVEGEISNFRPHSAGHFFSLKDEKAVLNAVIFNRDGKDLKFKIEDGLKVICFGKIDVYAPYGKYQIIIEKIEPKGIGGLQLALEQLKKRLEKEGLFSEEHKRPIPYLPKNIGIVTSIHGAAIKDILKVLDRRFKDIHIIVKSVSVQGDDAKEEISQAIKDLNYFNQQVNLSERIEVMIVGRGGGSIEDLWAFNEEIVARAIYNSKIPVISAVGHERDWTIADLVADLRAPTPSAAAEQVIPRKEDLQEELVGLIEDIKRAFFDIASAFEESVGDLTHRLNINMMHSWELNAGKFESVMRKLKVLNPAELIPKHKDRVLDLARQIQVRIGHFVKLREMRFVKSAEKITNLNPLNILSRGYSVTFSFPGNEIVKEAHSLKAGDVIKTRVHKGEFLSKVIEIVKNNPS